MDNQKFLEKSIFWQIVRECSRQPALLREFDRLSHTNLSRKGGGLVLAIDEATGKLASDAEKFLDFVYDCILRRQIPTNIPTWRGFVQFEAILMGLDDLSHPAQ